MKGLFDSVKQINIAVTGRRSGRRFSFPVWFMYEEDKLFLLPIQGSDSQWYRNVLKSRSLEVASVKTGLLSSQKMDIRGEVNLITDAGRIEAIAGKFRAKYGSGAVKRHYHKFDAGLEVILRP